MSATAALLAAVLIASPCPAGVDACRLPEGGYRFTEAGKQRVDAALTKSARDLAACTTERDFLHRVLKEPPVSAAPAPQAAPTSVSVAFVVGLAAGAVAGAYVTYKAMR